MMKPVLIIDSLGQGGAQKQLLNISKEFKKLKIPVDLIYYDNEAFYQKSFEKYCSRVIKLSRNEHLNRIIELKDIVDSNQYTHIISFLLLPSFYAAVLKIIGKKVTLIFSFRSSYKRLKDLKNRFLFYVTYSFCDLLIVNSLENLNYFHNRRKLKTKLIYNQIDNDFFKKQTSELTKPIKVTIIANYRDIKNGLSLFKAFSLLKKNERSNFEINWYGNDSKDGSFQKMINYQLEHKLWEIKLNSSTSNIKGVIDKADCVALFSLSEGFPNTLCEGASRGKLLISSKVGGIENLFPHQRQFFFEPNNIDQIVDSFRCMLRTKNLKLIEIQRMNYDIAKQNFSSTYNSFINSI